MNKAYLLAVALTGLATAAPATTLYDNGGPGGGSGNEATLWLQAENFVVAGGGGVSGAGVYLSDVSDDGRAIWDGLGNVIQWFIFADDAGNPQDGAPLSSGTAQNLSITDTGLGNGFGSGNIWLAEFDLGSIFAAVAGVQYWFGVHFDTDYADREEVYFVTTDASKPPTGHESLGGTLDNWSDNSQEHAFFLTGEDTPRIPLPATLPLALGAVAGLGLLRIRKG